MFTFWFRAIDEGAPVEICAAGSSEAEAVAKARETAAAFGVSGALECFAVVH